MKTAILSALFLLGAAPLVLAQGRPLHPAIDPLPLGRVEFVPPAPTDPGTVAHAPKVELTYVEPTLAFAPGRVELRGNNLHLVRAVRVAGHDVPIVFNDGRRMVIAPGQQDPGMASLELIRVGGKLDAQIEFGPCMTAQWHGQRARVQLHPGYEGWYVIQYSFRCLTTPETFPGTYYASMLDFTGGGSSGTYCSGTMAEDEVLTFPWMRVPTWGGPSAIGPMSLQALCLVGDQLSYSNVVTLRPRL